MIVGKRFIIFICLILFQIKAIASENISFDNMVNNYSFYYYCNNSLFCHIEKQIKNPNIKNENVFYVIDFTCEKSKLFNYYSNRDWSKKLDLRLLEELIKDKINNYRRKNGLVDYELNDTIMKLAFMEAKYACDNGGEKYDGFLNELNYIYGDKVYSSYNTSLLSYWNLERINDWSNVEDRMAEGYLLKFIIDNKENVVLVNKDIDGKSYHYNWGISAQIKGDIIYISELIYVNNK